MAPQITLPRPTPIRMVAVALGVLLACAHEEQVPTERTRFIDPPRGTLAPSYTLADETRPVLALPPERHLDLTVPAGQGDHFTFPLPDEVGASQLIASGSVQSANRTYALAAQLLARERDPAGGRIATITLPAGARAPDHATAVHLTLTTPPATPMVETQVEGVEVPEEGTLEFGVGLSAAAGAPGAAPIALEVAMRPDGGEEKTLWSTELRRGPIGAVLWRDVTLPVSGRGGRRARFVFRARPAGEGVPIVVPLWADPTIVAPGPRRPGRRNIILISIDTLRADRVGAYGAYRPTTPAIDALAAESVVFTNAWAPWPETSGSHMSLFSSRYPSEHGVTSFISAPPPSLELLAERLRRDGYLTRAFTEDGGVWADAGFARGFSAYGERRSPDFVYRGEVEGTFADATRWVTAHAERTFLLFVHTYQVHAPYMPPPDFRKLFVGIPGREDPSALPAALAYDQEVRYTDDHVGHFLETLRRLDLARRSIVILTSDHGEEFGEHGGRGHGRTLHREVLHVPLIVWAPGLLAPARVTSPASLLDVTPTILDLVGLEADPGHRGASLVAAARASASGSADGGEVAGSRPIFGEVDRFDHGRIQQVSVRRRGATAIADLSTGEIRCYGAADPAEGQPGSECPELAELIAVHRRESVPIGPAIPQPPDPRLLEKMRALGYVQ